jgi:hypothetical protein
MLSIQFSWSYPGVKNWGISMYPRRSRQHVLRMCPWMTILCSWWYFFWWKETLRYDTTGCWLLEFVRLKKLQELERLKCVTGLNPPTSTWTFVLLYHQLLVAAVLNPVARANYIFHHVLSCTVHTLSDHLKRPERTTRHILSRKPSSFSRWHTLARPMVGS